MLAEQMNRAAPGLPAGGAESTMEVMGRYMAEVLQVRRPQTLQAHARLAQAGSRQA